MKIIIVGAGRVGSSVAEALVSEANDITVIDTDPNRVAELQARGHETELVTIPFKWYPGTKVLSQAFLWRLADLEESDGAPIDLVVATKFPSYLVRHRNKRVWLVHQFRQAYELDGTELGQFGQSAEDRALRRKIQELDRLALEEATQLFPATVVPRDFDLVTIPFPERGEPELVRSGARTHQAERTNSMRVEPTSPSDSSS